MNGAVKKLPFRSVARQQMATLPVVPFSPNNRVDILFPKIGLLAVVTLRLRGWIRRAKTDTGAGTNFGANILNKITFALNTGATSIIDCSGLGLAMMQYLLERGMAPFGAGGVSNGTFSRQSTWDFDLANTAGPFVPDAGGGAPAVQVFPLNMQWMLPISLNDGRNFENGLINLQAAELQATLSLQCGSLLTDFFPAGSTVTGTFFSDAAGNAQNPNIEIEIEYYQLPNPLVAQLPPGVLHRIVEDRTPINALGDQTYTLLKQGLLLQLAHVVTLNGSLQSGVLHSDNTGSYVDDLRILLNVTNKLYQRTRFADAYLWRKRYATQINQGFFVHDFFHADQRVSHGDVRDTIDTETISTVQSVFNVQGTLGANNNYFSTIRRILQKAI